jgi:hypothetical protein
VLTVSPPGDFERFVEEVGQPTTDKAPSPSPTGSSDPAILEKRFWKAAGGTTSTFTTAGGMKRY